MTTLFKLAWGSTTQRSQGVGSSLGLGSLLVFLLTGLWSPVVAPGQSAVPLNGNAASSNAPGSQGTPVTRLPGVRRFVVLLDAAHGGDDSGAQLAESTAEKTVTLALSVRLRSLLNARGLQVTTTREGNANLSYDARAQIANHANAAACFSLHASETGAGVHIFVSSLEPKEPTRFMAWKTAQAAYVTRSLKLASVVNSAFEHSSIAGGASGNGLTTDTGPIPATLTRTSLPGVDSMTCPSVALEIAPIRGADRKVITEVTDEQYQTQVVEALAAAILEWRTDWDAEAHPFGVAGGSGNGVGGVRQP